jgi:hypothetical protein
VAKSSKRSTPPLLDYTDPPDRHFRPYNPVKERVVAKKVVSNPSRLEMKLASDVLDLAASGP